MVAYEIANNGLHVSARIWNVITANIDPNIYAIQECFKIMTY